MSPGLYFPPTMRGTVAQRLAGNTVMYGGVPAFVSKQRLVVLPIGDSATEAYDFREGLWRWLRRYFGKVKFLGNKGMGAGTGGKIGRRYLDEWRHEGHGGYRTSQTTTFTVNTATGVLTCSPASGIGLHNPVVFSTTGTLPSGLLPNKVYWTVAAAGSTHSVSATEGGAAIASFGDTGTGVHTMGYGILQLWDGLVNAYDEDPDLIYLRIGANDGFSLIPVDTGLANLYSIIDKMRATYPRADILVCPPPPIVDGTSTNSNLSAYQASRETYRAAWSAVSRGINVGYVDTERSLGPGNMQSDGVHPNKQGCAAEGKEYTLAALALLGVPYVADLQRPIYLRPATASVSLPTNTDGVTVAYHHALSPGRTNAGVQVVQSFGFGLGHYPTALPTDGLVRCIVKYGTTHPDGFLLGHRATSGLGGGVSIYLSNASAGAAVMSGATAAAYSGEALRVNQWHRIWAIFDMVALRCGLFINGRLIQWVAIPPTWTTIAEQSATTFGRFGGFNASLGLYDSYVIAKGSHLNVSGAAAFVEADYRDWELPIGVSAHYGLSAGSGTTYPPISYGHPTGTAIGAPGWSAAGAVPKPVDELAI